MEDLELVLELGADAVPELLLAVHVAPVEVHDLLQDVALAVGLGDLEAVAQNLLDREARLLVLVQRRVRERVRHVRHVRHALVDLLAADVVGEVLDGLHGHVVELDGLLDLGPQVALAVTDPVQEHLLDAFEVPRALAQVALEGVDAPPVVDDLRVRVRLDVADLRFQDGHLEAEGRVHLLDHRRHLRRTRVRQNFVARSSSTRVFGHAIISRGEPKAWTLAFSGVAPSTLK